MRGLLLLLLLFPAIGHAQPPPGYYDPAAGLTGEPLRVALYGIISPHVVIQYSNLWSAFFDTDRKPNNTVWDIYSDIPTGTPTYSYQFVSDQCGTYSGEGDCFNREHTFPVSWFNDVPPMNSDLFHIYPTDGWVNQKRANWPYGTVSSPTWTSDNGSKLGPCSWPGCSGTVFEPIDEYKGDLARGYFYMLTRYMNESVSWPAPILSSGEFFSWTESLLLDWHTQDPVSPKETARNNSAFALQGNRNPYIDNPQWVYSIWGPLASVEDVGTEQVHVWFANDELTIVSGQNFTNLPLRIMDATGRTVMSTTLSGDRITLPFHAGKGIYVAALGEAPQRTVLRFVR